MVTTTEIAPEVYRLAVFVPEINLEFSHFLVRDDEPLLFHAGLRSMFPLLREEVSRLIDLSKLRHIGFSHFESDECGALNHWLELAPAAQPVCGLVGAIVSVNDFSIRPARVLTREDTLSTGRYRFRFLPTPHVPHGWDAGVLFEESEKTLFCSDLFHHGATVNRPQERTSWNGVKTRYGKPKQARLRTTCLTPIIPGACSKAWPNRNRRRWPRCMARATTAMAPKPCEIWRSSCARYSGPKPRREKQPPLA